MKQNKISQSDHIIAEIVKEARNELCYELAKLYNKCLKPHEVSKSCLSKSGRHPHTQKRSQINQNKYKAAF